MPTVKILAAIMLVTFLGSASANSDDSKSNQNSEKEKCTYVYEGKHSKFGVKEKGICWRLPRGALKMKDTSWRRPLGGPTSIGNEVIRKGVQKPLRWAKKRLGLKW